MRARLEVWAQVEVYLLTIAITILLLVFGPGLAEARDLVDAAASAQSFFNRIGIAAISIGLTLGGILFALGVSQLGRMLLISGFIGAIAILGAPALIGLLGRIFGAAL
jgi:hypothetical protein